MNSETTNSHLFPRSELWRNAGVACAIIGLLTMLVYFRSLQAPCYIDDFPYVVQNPLIQSVPGVFDQEAILASQVDADVKNSVLTRPLSYLTFSLNYALHGTDVRGYHLVNTLIHIGIFVVLRQFRLEIGEHVEVGPKGRPVIHVRRVNALPIKALAGNPF